MRTDLPDTSSTNEAALSADEAGRITEDALTLAGMSLEHTDSKIETQNIRDRINNISDEHSAILAAILNAVAQWLTDAADDRDADAQILLAHTDPWERVVGAAAVCETATLNDLAAEVELAARLVENPNHTTAPRRTATPSAPRQSPDTPSNADRGSISRSGLKWYRRAWDSADADGSVDDVIAAVNDPTHVTSDPAGHGRTRLSKDDITVVVTPDGVILAWWRGDRN